MGVFRSRSIPKVSRWNNVLRFDLVTSGRKKKLKTFLNLEDQLNIIDFVRIVTNNECDSGEGASVVEDINLNCVR